MICNQCGKETSEIAEDTEASWFISSKVEWEEIDLCSRCKENILIKSIIDGGLIIQICKKMEVEQWV